VASPADLPFIFELEAWSNDRISAELGLLHCLPESEWVAGPQATVIMAAFCHPRQAGGRFNDVARGAWYAARKLATAHAEIAFHRTKELAEVGVFETSVQMRLYLADFNSTMHDVRAEGQDPNSYERSQRLARELLAAGSNGAIYRSVRDPTGDCIACFRPKLVANVRPDAHFEYRWEGQRTPTIRQL
jgi:hypothetical protein